MPKIFSILFLFFAGIFPSLVHAEIQSCFSSITPTTTYTNSQATISVIVEQQSDGPANWIQVYVPPALPYVSAAATGWSVSEQDQYVTFTGGQLQPYQTATFNITVETGSTPDGPWQLSTYVADNGTGEPNVGCDGSSGLTVLDGSSNVQLSAITLRNITDSQATLTFTTNIAATSQVVYGTTTSYGSTKTNSTATTSHSFTLDGLSKNTSYNFQISATSGSSSASSGNQTFTSAATSANLTPTIIYISPTTGPTPTAIIQIMPTPTPLPDRTKPTITIQALQSLPYKSPPTITGTVGDNVSVSWLEYSVDAGKTWNRIKEATGLNTNYVTFSFVPTIQQLNNGANSLLIRARDTANNPAISSPLTFTLDTQGPEIFLSTSFDKPFTVSPTVKGSATDQSGETRIEYAVLHQCSNGSTQQCRNVVSSFQPVDSTSFSGDTTSFTTRLPPLDDGTYLLQIKATDPLGNEQVQIFQTLIIDRLAPQFGSHVLHVGPIVLQPETNHVYLVPQQKEIQIILSLIGGPDQVQITGSSSPVQLLYNPVTNLWQGTLLFSEPGITTVAGTAKDGAGNITNTTLFTVQTIAHGTITNGYGTYINSTIKILQKDQETGRFLPWEADVYSQKNLQQQSEKLEQLLATREEQYMLQLNTQKAMLNLLEDEKDLQDQIKHDKEMVERTVDERTKELANKNIALEQAHKDISDAWLSVQREKARLTASINSLPNGFILTDQDGNVFMINNAAKYILGMTENIYELRAFSQTIKEGFNIEEIVQHTKEEKTIQKKHDVAINGKIINITVVPILLEPNNQFLGTAIVIDDVTERKIMERARDEFFSIASHELRTPLTSIRGNTAMIVQYFADILNEKTELKEMIDDIHSSSVRLISIVNDFLNVSRLEMKRMTYKYSDFNIVDLITKVHKELEPNAAEKHDTVTLQTSSDSLPLVHADPDRVKEVLLNLIGNAIKFTDNGSVTTHVRMENTHIRVEVTDSGLGIPQKQQDLLFRKFQQAEENIYTRDTSKSSGLGLYISKLLIEEMKGTIGLARSEEGKGSTFYFTLPIQNEEHSSEQHEPMKLNT